MVGGVGAMAVMQMKATPRLDSSQGGQNMIVITGFKKRDLVDPDRYAGCLFGCLFNCVFSCLFGCLSVDSYKLPFRRLSLFLLE